MAPGIPYLRVTARAIDASGPGRKWRAVKKADGCEIDTAKMQVRHCGDASERETDGFFGRQGTDLTLRDD